MAHVLLIEDMASLRTVMTQFLEDAGHSVQAVHDGASGVSALDRQKADVVITDMILPKQDGNDVIDAVRSRHNGTPIIAISGGDVNVAPETALADAKRKADAWLAKPFGRDALLDTVDKLSGGNR